MRYNHCMNQDPIATSTANSALLIVDLQNDYCAAGGYMEQHLQRDVSSVAHVAGTIGNLARAARQASVPVIWVRAAYDPKYINPPMLGKQQERGVAGQVLCAEGSWGAEFFELAPKSGETVISKHRFSAFHDTGLTGILQDAGITSIVVSGVSTNVCIDSTVRDGFMAGFHIVVPRDCVASYSNALHLATLENINVVFGRVCDSFEVITEWEQ